MSRPAAEATALGCYNHEAKCEGSGLRSLCQLQWLADVTARKHPRYRSRFTPPLDARRGLAHWRGIRLLAQGTPPASSRSARLGSNLPGCRWYSTRAECRLRRSDRPARVLGSSAESSALSPSLRTRCCSLTPTSVGEPSWVRTGIQLAPSLCRA